MPVSFTFDGVLMNNDPKSSNICHFLFPQQRSPYNVLNKKTICNDIIFLLIRQDW